MKEANPVSLRFGISNSCKINGASPALKLFDNQFRFELFLYKLTLDTFESEMYYTIINPVMLFINAELIIYFYFYATQFTARRLRVRIRRRRIREMRSLLNKKFRLTCQKPKRYQFTKTIIITPTTAYKYQIRNNNPTNKLQYLTRQKPKIGLLKQFYLYSVKKRLENIILKTTETVTRCFFKSIFSVLLSKRTLHIRYKTYIIYKRFFYYHKTDNYVDTINIILYTLRYQRPNFLISFVCRELERTPYHNRFLKMMKQILVEFYETVKIFSGFKLSIRGPVNKHARTKRLHYTVGSVPTQTFTENIEYFNFFSNTKFGTLGLRLWIYC
jgi:hypothetical protein